MEVYNGDILKFLKGSSEMGLSLVNERESDERIFLSQYETLLVYLGSILSTLSLYI